MTTESSRASEKKRIAKGGQRLPGGIIDAKAVKALQELREHWPAWPVIKILEYAIIDLRRRHGP